MTAVESSVANWFETSLSSSVGASDLTFNVDSIGTLTSPALIVIDPRSATKREVVRADGVWGASSFVASSLARRGLAGSAGGAQAHDADTKVVVVPLAQHIEDIHDRVDEHAAAADPHPDYLTTAEGNAAYVALADHVEPVTEADALTWYEGNNTAVAATSYHTVFDVTSGGAELLGGSFFGPSPGVRLTIDGTVVLNATAELTGRDSSGTDSFGVVALPAAKADSTMKLEIYNPAAASKNIGWRVVTR